ncbi:MAG TPA: DUF3185 family protein [Nitrospirota bacterium]|nr:DUF3185 family protein [Nitrospirota bacterium]
MSRQAGLVLLVAGIGLLMWGYNLSGSFSSRFYRTFTGSLTDKTAVILICGSICTALGLFNLLRRVKK